jgi:hypothetical protein
LLFKAWRMNSLRMFIFRNKIFNDRHVAQAASVLSSGYIYTYTHDTGIHTWTIEFTRWKAFTHA